MELFSHHSQFFSHTNSPNTMDFEWTEDDNHNPLHFSLGRLNYYNQYSQAVARLWTLGIKRNNGTSNDFGFNTGFGRDMYHLTDDFSSFHGAVYLCAIGFDGESNVRVNSISATWCSKENYVKPRGKLLNPPFLLSVFCVWGKCALLVINMYFCCTQFLIDCSFTFITACPRAEGYTSYLGKDHYLDDISCEPQLNVTEVAKKCNNDSTCNAFIFNYILGDSCIKTYAGDPTDKPGYIPQGCYYKKATTSNHGSESINEASTGSGSSHRRLQRSTHRRLLH